MENLEKETVSISIKFKLNDERTIKRTPYIVLKPIDLSEEDTYKFAMYVLIKKGFEQQSGDFVSRIGANIIKLDKKKYYDS